MTLLAQQIAAFLGGLFIVFFIGWVVANTGGIRGEGKPFFFPTSSLSRPKSVNRYIVIPLLIMLVLRAMLNVLPLLSNST